MFAGVLEVVADAACDCGVHRLRDHHTAGFTQCLQPRGDVDSVAIDAAIRLLEDVAQVHADAKGKPR
jgi:hypothetical protein